MTFHEHYAATSTHVPDTSKPVQTATETNQGPITPRLFMAAAVMYARCVFLPGAGEGAVTLKRYRVDLLTVALLVTDLLLTLQVPQSP